MDDVREGVIDEFVGPDAVPFSGKFCPLRFVQIDGEIAVKRIGQRSGLVRTAGQHLFGDHRIEDVVDRVAGGREKIEVKAGVVKYLDDAFIRKNVRQRPEPDAFAERHQHVEFTIRELHRIEPARRRA